MMLSFLVGISHTRTLQQTQTASLNKNCKTFTFTLRKELLEVMVNPTNYCFHRDLMSWINGIRGLVSSEELAKDVTGAEALLERHQVINNLN